MGKEDGKNTVRARGGLCCGGAVIVGCSAYIVLVLSNVELVLHLCKHNSFECHLLAHQIWFPLLSADLVPQAPKVILFPFQQN